MRQLKGEELDVEPAYLANLGQGKRSRRSSNPRSQSCSEDRRQGRFWFYLKERWRRLRGRSPRERHTIAVFHHPDIHDCSIYFFYKEDENPLIGSFQTYHRSVPSSRRTWLSHMRGTWTHRGKHLEINLSKIFQISHKDSNLSRRRDSLGQICLQSRRGWSPSKEAPLSFFDQT